MTDNIKIEGFDTEPGALDESFKETRSEQSERIGRQASADRVSSEVSRRANDEVVNKRLFALRDQVTALHGRLNVVDSKVDTHTNQLTSVDMKLEKNNVMTKEVLDILGGGKMLVNLIKLAGVIAVPVTAIVTAIHVFTKGP